jgi:hypothetical protein
MKGEPLVPAAVLVVGKDGAVVEIAGAWIRVALKDAVVLELWSHGECSPANEEQSSLSR